MKAGGKRYILWSFCIGMVILLAVLARPVGHLYSTALRDADDRAALPANYVDDASRLNETRIRETRQLDVESEDPEGQLAELLLDAGANGFRVAVAGARHSMGGHTIYPGGIVLDMTGWNRMEFDSDRELLTVQSGATWNDVIAYLDPLGLSVQIMQSNDSFTVGGSLSVNCHGWQYDRPPIASSVESFRLMKADGEIVRCSRRENSELFSLALGGYGLFGVILDVDLRVTANDAVRLEQYLFPVDEALLVFDQKLRGREGLELAFARLNVAPEAFLEDGLVHAFVTDPDAELLPLVGGENDALLQRMLRGSARAVFRGSAESDYGKGLRWDAETSVTPLLEGRLFSRNQLLDEGVETLENRSATTTDILHEYFVPRPRAGDFVRAMREIIPRHEGNLLNVTVRGVNEDRTTFLRYADSSVLSFVLLFLQERAGEGEEKMGRMTRDLIDAALDHGGRYYLPYRMHATREQFHRAYPQAREFFDLKRKYDPQEIFQNKFYLKYGGARSGGERRDG